MNNEFLSKVFRWFGVGLLVTFLVAYLVSTSTSALTFIFSGSTYLIIFILEIVIGIFLSVRIGRLSKGVTAVLYLGYSALTGLTFSSIFIVYEISSIIWIFLASALVFFIFSLLGKSDKINLAGYGIYLMVALIISLVLELINIFLLSSTLDMFLNIFVLVIFTVYVAYDIRKILTKYPDSDNMAIYGAFDLYLDFINIFLRLLSLFGKERD